MTVEQALAALAEPQPEPFRQVKWLPIDYVRFDVWNRRRIEARKVAAAQTAG